MSAGVLVGLGLEIGMAILTGCTPIAAEMSATYPGAPTSLVPEAYGTAPSASVAKTAFSGARGGSLPPPAGAPVTRAAPFPAPESNPYHPYWLVDVH
jgi:hypothetical protein